MCCWRRLRRLAAGLIKHKFHRDAFERRAFDITGSRQHMWYVEWCCCASTRSQNILHTDFEYVTQHSFVERWWRLRPSYRTLKRSLVRGEAHTLWNRMQLVESHRTVQLASHTKELLQDITLAYHIKPVWSLMSLKCCVVCLNGCILLIWRKYQMILPGRDERVHQSKIRQQQSSLWEHIKRELQVEYRLGEWKWVRMQEPETCCTCYCRMNQEETVELALAQKVVISFEVH